MEKHICWGGNQLKIPFWSEVYNYTDASGSKSFKELCKAALAALPLPHSNAEVERLFSQRSVVKWKLRNKLSLHTLNSILLMWYGLKLAGDTCYQHKLHQHRFRFWNMQSSTKHFTHLPILGFTICDVTNRGKPLCSPNEPFVVVSCEVALQRLYRKKALYK